MNVGVGIKEADQNLSRKIAFNAKKIKWQLNAEIISSS